MQVPNLFLNIESNKSLTYIVRKNNTVLYKQNSYQVPKGTYEPGLEVELKIVDNKMAIVNKRTTEIIVSHTLITSKGGLAQIHHPERDKSTTRTQLYETTLLALGSSNEAKELLETIAKEKPRYVKDQYSLIVKVIKNYDEQVIKESVLYCLERKLYSASIFKEALVYLDSQRKTKSEEPSKPYKAADLNIPLKYKGLKPEDRNINEYVDCFKGARKE